MKLATFGLLLLFFYLFVFPTTVYAYLDPSTGSIALQVIVGGLLAALATIRLYWKRIKSITNWGQTPITNRHVGDRPQLQTGILPSQPPIARRIGDRPQSGTFNHDSRNARPESRDTSKKRSSGG
jgi:hypothetical protein